MVTETDNLARLNVALAEYIQHSRQTVDEAIAKQGAKLSFALSRRLRAEKPGKGEIRAERLAALKAGGGVRVRDSIRKKISGTKRFRKGGLNLQARRVKAELNLRERGKGFLAYGTRINVGKLSATTASRVGKVGRYGQTLASAGLRFNTDSSRIEFIFGGSKTELGDTLAKPRFRKHIDAAIGDVADDIQVYLDRKLAQRNG